MVPDYLTIAEAARLVRAILAKLRPEPVREPLPPLKVYAPLHATSARRRR